MFSRVCLCIVMLHFCLPMQGTFNLFVYLNRSLTIIVYSDGFSMPQDIIMADLIHIPQGTKQGLLWLESWFSNCYFYFIFTYLLNFCDTHIFFCFLLICKTYFSSRITILCENKKLAFLVQNLLQIV